MLPSKEELEKLRQLVDRPQATRVPPGIYQGRIIRIGEQRSRKTGHAMLSVEFRLINLADRPRLHRFVMCEGAGVWLYLNFLEAVAFQGETQQSDPDGLLNRVCDKSSTSGKRTARLARSSKNS